VRRLLLVLTVAVLGVVMLAPPASAEQYGLDDAVNEVPYDRGDITSITIKHTSAKLILNLRTALGGNPENVWPNRQTYIRWKIDTNFGAAGPEYYADIRIARGVDTVMIGRVRRVSDNQLMCSAQNHVPGNNVVAQAQNLYKFAFLRGCVGAPSELRARATFRWDNGNPNVGPVYTDYAPNGGPSLPLSAG
jgi:hypothetical protein